jgi:hypothetical protein
MCDYLVAVESAHSEPVPVPPQVQKDLGVWAEAVRTAGLGLPIPGRPLQPSLLALRFVSDAAGAQFAKIAGRFIPIPNRDDRGAASVGYLPGGQIWFYSRVIWPKNLLLHARDTNDHAYGCKSPTLEAVRVLLPFLTVPQHMIGHDILLHTDNEAVVYGWASRRIKNDHSASIIIRCVHVISALLGCRVYIEHLAHMSTTEAILADHLTIDSMTGPAEQTVLAGIKPHPVPKPLVDWLEHPTEDWTLVDRLLEHVSNIVQPLM